MNQHLTRAICNFTDATTAWTSKFFGRLILGESDDGGLDEAYIQMRCAGAILAWEMVRAGLPAPRPDAPWWFPQSESAVYDDDTIAALLGGIR